jgi:tRNA nucleotidyltransferase (CCA-adding enzyme)
VSDSLRRRLDPPAPVREIVARLERAGYETWCVGGAVRDALLGHAHLDWDLATAATPQQVMKVFKRTVPVGIAFGTVGVLDDAGTMHEVTTFRHDVKTDGRHAEVAFGASLDEDLARRDFTINAIAYHPQREELHDPFEGQLDLKRGLVRAVGEPDQRMREDRLRALRGIRFAGRFGFHIEPSTWRAIVGSAPHLGRLSGERVLQELTKTMQQIEKPSVSMLWWRESGALRTLLPVIAEAPDERFEAIDFLPRGEGAEEAGRTLDRLAMLFFGSDPSSIRNALGVLKCSNAQQGWITALAKADREIGGAVDAVLADRLPTATEVRRWVAAVGRMRSGAFFGLKRAMYGARALRADGAAVAERADACLAMVSHAAFHEPVELSDLAVSGDDLVRAGVPAGPELGVTLRRLLEFVLEDPTRNQRDLLLTCAMASDPSRNG